MFEPVSLYKCDSYDYDEVSGVLSKALSDIDGLSFVKPGMIVAIKANLVTGMAPEKAGTTHPQLIKRLCQMITDLGASVVIGDSPGGLYTPVFVKNIYRGCGLTSMVEDLEKELQAKGSKQTVSLNEDFSISDGTFDGKSLRSFIYTGWLDKVDAIINVSKLKSHAMMGMSCAVKNMFGTIPGATKPEYHMRFPEEMAFANVMVDLNEFFKPALYVVDAIDGMEGNGPTAGEKRHIGAILASKRPYALDMACADIINMGINDCQTLKAAYERNLGPKDISEINVVGDASILDIKVLDFKRATSHQSINFEGGGLFNKVKSVAIRTVFNTRPELKKDECIGCKKCFETCPAKAITMVPGKNALTDSESKASQIPQIDRSKCIKCFCCQEFCPKGAMKVHETNLAKVIHKINQGR
ncbi:MAG: DUF362 domain-containing protein [Butyrivibrio sp.]|nr:DUF362 domain-containing protein [Butyrivibrio sp.]